MATEVGNIHIGLYVDVGDSRRFTDVANLVERDSRRMNTALGNTTRSVAALRGQMNQSLRFRIASDSLRQLSRATGEMERLRAAMLGVAAITGTGVTGAFTAAYLVQTADKARLLGNQIKTVTADTAEFAAVQDALFRISQRTRSSLESTTQIYARTARATETLGTSQEKVLKLTEAVQKAFAIGGATPQEATGAAIQLSQGIASDRFSGEEFRSVAENAPVLLKGMADSLGVNIGELRKMAIEGELTAKVVTEAIIKAADSIDKEFAKMTPTVAQSFTMLDNTFLRYVGSTDEAYGFTKKLSGAIVSLSENFDEAMWWITRVTAGLAALYAARKLVLGGQSRVAGMRADNAAIGEEISDRTDANKAISRRIEEINRQISEARAKVTTAETAAINRQSDMVNKAKEGEFAAQQKVNELQAARNTLTEKFSRAQSAAVTNLQREVDLARQRVRDDQLRVIQAQEAAAAEERNLRARQQQALARADQQVVAANGKVFDTLDRVGQTNAAIKAEQDLARTRLKGEIDARRQSLVTAAQRLASVQSQISELRMIQDLPGFDKEFGAQYQKLLREQQKAIIHTSNLRKEISGLDQQLSDVDAGGATTKGISAAMARNVAAIKKAEAAIISLGRAETARDKIASAPLSGKSLEARLAAEVKETERYQASIAALQSRMTELREVTAGTFAGGAAKKMLGDIDALDKKIAAAQTTLRNATDSVASAQNGDMQMLQASLAAQSKAASEVASLQDEANMLLERQLTNTLKIEAAQKRLNVLRRVGNNVLGFFGGWTGLAITAALVAATAAMAHFAAKAAEAAENTERTRKQLRDMGYLAADAADAMTGFKEDVAAGRISKLTDEVQNFQKEIDKAIDSLKEIDVAEGATRATIKPFEMPEGLSSFGQNKRWQEYVDASKAAEAPVKNALANIRDEMLKNKTMSDEMRKALEDMALANPALASTTLSLIKIGEQLNALTKASKDWLENIRQAQVEAGRSTAERFRAAENKSMSDLDALNTSAQPFLAQMDRENAWSEYEGRVQAEMKKIADAAEKLGKTLTQSALRVQAEENIAADIAKKGLRDLIGYYEGTDKGRGYNETLGYGKFAGGDVNLTAMTLREVLDLQKKMLADPTNTFNSSAVGRYQITAETLKDFMPRLGLSMDDTFSAELQDRIADAIIRSTGGDLSKLRGRWEGLLKASDQQISTAAGVSFQNLPRLDETQQKWLEGIKDLDLKASITALSDFDQQVIQTAMSMGVSRDAVDQFIAAVKSGDLKKIPEQFQQIAQKMREAVTNGFGRQLDNLRFSNTVELLGEVDKKVVEVARSFGIGEEAIKQYVEAIRNGNLEAIPPQFMAIREEVAKLSSIQFSKEFVSGGLTDIRSALEDGKITWSEWRDVAMNALNRVADKLQEMLIDSFFSKTGFNLFGSLFGVGGLGAGGSSSGGLPGMSGGGYTGDGAKLQAAGIVHAGEFVFDAESTKRAGVRNLMMLHEMLKTGRFPSNDNLPGFDRGGFVGRLPKFDDGGFVNRVNGVGQMHEAVRQSFLRVVVDMDPEGNWRGHVERSARGQADAAVDEKVPHMIMGGLSHYTRNVLPGDVNRIAERPIDRKLSRS